MEAVLPRLNGVDATVEIHRESPDTRTILLLTEEDRRLATDALRARVSGLVLVSSPLADLVTAIEQVAGGARYLSTGLTDVVLDGVARAGGEQPGLLTLRERVVLQLVSEGKSAREIAGSLHISPRTVESHRRHVMDKLRLRSLPDLTKYAIRNRLTSIDP